MNIKKDFHFTPHLFGTCDEEEKMRSIVTMVREVQSSPSLPHVKITFDRIEFDRIIFQILLVRQKKMHVDPVEVLIQKMDPTFIFIPDRIQAFNDIEVNSFFLELAPITDLLRSDFSVRFLSARRKIVKIFEKGLKNVRDYNGGLFAKKEESLRALMQAFPAVKEEFVEDFFCSIHPVKEQATLPQKTLFTFFQQLISHLTKECRLFFYQDKEHSFTHLTTQHSHLLTFLRKKFYHEGIDLYSFISANVSWKGVQQIIFLWKDPKFKELFERFYELHLREMYKIESYGIQPKTSKALL